MTQLLLSLLIILRLKNKTLYQEYIRGDRTGNEVMNYIDELAPLENRLRELEPIFNEIEIRLYLADRATHENSSRSLDELERLHDNLKNEQKTPHTPYLSERTQKSDIQRINNLSSFLSGYPGHDFYVNDFSEDTIIRLSGLIELSQSFIRD